MNFGGQMYDLPSGGEGFLKGEVWYIYIHHFQGLRTRTGEWCFFVATTFSRMMSWILRVPTVSMQPPRKSNKCSLIERSTTMLPYQKNLSKNTCMFNVLWLTFKDMFFVG